MESKTSFRTASGRRYKNIDYWLKKSIFALRNVSIKAVIKEEKIPFELSAKSKEEMENVP